MEAPDENRLDQSLRHKFDDFDLSPDAQVWAGIEQRLTPPPRLRPRRRWPVPLPLLFGLVALLAGLLGWLLPHESPSGAAPRLTAVNGAAQPVGQPAEVSGLRAAADPRATGATSRVGSAAQPRAASGGLVRSVGADVRPGRRPARAANGRQARQGVSVQTAPALPNPTSTPVLTPTNDQTRQSPAADAARAAGASVTLAAAPASSSGQNADAAPSASQAVAAGVGTAAAESTPTSLRQLVALERQVLTQLPSIETLPPGPPAAGRHADLIRTLRAQRGELLRLQRRTDSTLLALGAGPLAAPAVAASQPDSAVALPVPPPVPARRWSLLLSTAPEQNTLSLRGRPEDSLSRMRRYHETGRGGFNASLLAEYQLRPRLSLGAGLGYSTYGANLRLTTKNTEVRVTYDTTTTRTTTAFTRTNRTYSIRIIQIPQLSPVFNGNGQVIRYDTVYIPRQDTLFTTILQHDTIRSTTRTVTPLISKKETLSTKVLKPNYRFFTVPLLVRYRLTPGSGRWWTDVAAGAQLQFFLGGTQVVTEDGQNFRSEAITARNGPFRALNLALSGSLALNYALTPRLSLSLAPSLRWQTLSVYKAETGLIQQPVATGLQVGLRVKL